LDQAQTFKPLGGSRQEPAETLTTADITCLHRRLAVNQLVADPLMIPLAVVVDHELVDRVSEVTLPQRDHAM